jgi:glycosyltransferase involved in cell wall biosynthesis
VLEATLGGTRRYLEDLAAASNGGAYVNALAFGTARADTAFHRLLENMRADSWQTFEIDLRRRVDLRHDFSCVAKLREIIAHFEPDIIHGHSSKGGAIARLAVAGRRKRPAIVYTPAAVAVDLGLHYRLAEHALSPLTDVFVAVSASERQQLIDLHLGSPESVRVVSPTIDSAHFAPRDRRDARVAVGLGSAPVVIGIGRLAPQKDPLGFVDAIIAARKLVPNLEAVWVGDGDLRDGMEAAIAGAGLEGIVRITGWLTDVRPYIAACDVFLSCAAYESFGYVTAEALAMERPVVASRITGTIDIVTTDVDRSLFSPRDFQAAATAIADLVRNPEVATDVARRGRQSVLDAFSPDTTRNQLGQAYEQALLRAPKRASYTNAVSADASVAESSS